MLTLSKTEIIPTPLIPRSMAMSLVPVAPARWRVVDRLGRAVGHLDATSTPDGVRFSAKRYHAPTRSFRDLGTFWSATDAIDCLRLSR